MEREIVIIGAGDFGREVIWLIDRINEASIDKWRILGFLDDDAEKWGRQIGGYPVLGGTEWLAHYTEDIYAVCTVGTGEIRKKIIDKLSVNPQVHYPSLVDPSVLMGNGCIIGEGSILCAGNILTVDVQIGRHVILGLQGTFGHDDQIGDYGTINPGCNISGKVVTGECVDMGTGTKVIQGIHIVKNTVIGAGSIVVRDIEQSGTYVGTPAKAIKLRY